MLGSNDASEMRRPGRRNDAPSMDRPVHAGPPHGRGSYQDRAGSVCPVIAVFLDAWREGLPADERIILTPLAARTNRTHATPRIEEARALMAADWLVRICAPAWLNLAGLREQARLLYDLPQVTEAAQASGLRATLAEVSRVTHVEAMHVDEAGWLKASEDCWASAWAAAYEAAGLAAHDPAWVSAAAVSRAAAGLAAHLPTHALKAALQTSAAELVVRMARFGSRPES